VVAKSLAQDPKPIIRDARTHGVDVGSAEEMQEPFGALRERAKLLWSLKISGRILVAHGAQIVPNLTRVNASACAGMFQLGKELPDRSSSGNCFGSKISPVPAERMA
jgi:ABC-type sugar transport system ATPase subunit